MNPPLDGVPDWNFGKFKRSWGVVVTHGILSSPSCFWLQHNEMPQWAAGSQQQTPVTLLP